MSGISDLHKIAYLTHSFIFPGTAEQRLTGSGNIVGGITTSAQQRAITAQGQVVQELLDNSRKIGVLLQTIETRIPTRFGDVRRANETELQYQDRAKAEFRDYRSEISAYLQQIGFSTQVRDSF
jgi:hypothetical protein